MIAVTTILVAVLIALPIIVAKRSARKQKNRLKLELDRLAASRKLDFQKIQTFHNRIIGLDRSGKSLLYLQDEGGNFRWDLVDLRTVSRCQVVDVVSKNRTTSGSGRESVEAHIREVQLHLHASNTLLAFVTFYSEAWDGVHQMMEHRKIAEDWKKEIGELVQ